LVCIKSKTHKIVLLKHPVKIKKKAYVKRLQLI